MSYKFTYIILLLLLLVSTVSAESATDDGIIMSNDNTGAMMGNTLILISIGAICLAAAVIIRFMAMVKGE